MPERILIVAKTQMKSGVCVGGLTASNRSVRLVPEDRQNRRNCSIDTKFDVGQVWDVDFYESVNLDPPHVEDIIVTNAHYKGQAMSLKNVLMRRIVPWQGGIEALFNNSLFVNLKSGKCYVSRTGPIPNCSTGYWLPNKALTLTCSEKEKLYYQMNYRYKRGSQIYERAIAIPFIGCSDPIESILPNMLVRVSLARWLPSGSEERCYLQISGCYG